jgi:hypothetical protein
MPQLAALMHELQTRHWGLSWLGEYHCGREFAVHLGESL